MITIEEFSNIEKIMVNEAPVKYGEVYQNAEDLVMLLLNCITSQVKSKSWIFVGFLTQVQKSILLALMSVLRKHDVQALMMLRNALESSVLAVYSLYEINPDNYGTINETGNMDINQKIRINSYKWIDENYHYHSEKIKYFKDMINNSNAHANFGLIFNNIDFSTSNFLSTTLFDDNDGDKEHQLIMTNQRLWLIANISFGLLNLLYQAIEQYPLVTLIDGFLPKLEQYGSNNALISERLKHHPRFEKIISTLENETNQII